MRKPKIQCNKCSYILKHIVCPFTNVVTIKSNDTKNGMIYIEQNASDLVTMLNTLNLTGKCKNFRANHEIPNELIILVRDWLDGNGGREFFVMIKNTYGRIDTCWYKCGFLCSIHFNEGMKVRNFIRSTGIVNNWSCCDLDDMWVEIVEKSLGI